MRNAECGIDAERGINSEFPHSAFRISAGLLLGHDHRVAAAVIGQLVVVDAEHQAARRRHWQRLRLRADAERGAVADAAELVVPGMHHDALADPQTSLDQLTDLRDRARSTLEQQGDLEGALARLEDELARR